VRATLTKVHGFSAFTVMRHSRSRLFSPEIGGINVGTAYAPVAVPTTIRDSNRQRIFSISSRKRICGDFGWG
jgi:hypothetical protein